MSDHLKKEHKVPIPSYFDIQDGQTPSNTPSNKIKGSGLSYDITNFDFTSKFDNDFKDNNDIDEELNNNNNNKGLEYCVVSLIGTGETGLNTNDSKENLEVDGICCSNLFCEICYAKVNKIVGYKWDENTNNPNLNLNEKSLIDEHLAKDENYNFYYCKCKMQNIKEKSKPIKDLNLNWDCDGHKKYHN